MGNFDFIVPRVDGLLPVDGNGGRGLDGSENVLSDLESVDVANLVELIVRLALIGPSLSNNCELKRNKNKGLIESVIIILGKIISIQLSSRVN